MAFPGVAGEKLVHSIRLSSVGPSKVTGTDVVHEPKPMDLAMKLHYLRGVYYFTSQAAEGLTISSIKESMFEWLNTYYKACGRFKRWPETGRPYIKCNDCGVRMIEAVCDKTVDEWLKLLMLEEDNICHLRKLLFYDQVIGPEISFSPPLLVQITQFKCGGMSLGLSWAHVLGDAISAIDCINMWGQLLVGLQSDSPKPSEPKPISTISKSPRTLGEYEPVSLKRVDPVGDHWAYNSGSNMKTFTFHLTHPQLNHVRSKFFRSDQTPLFESLCAVLWKSIAEARGGVGSPSNVVTICKNDSIKRVKGALTNSQKISVVKAEFSILGSGPSELLGLLMAQSVEENDPIEEAVERDNGLGDFIIYGANLTFVDLGEADLYGLEVKGLRPVFADYSIHGVGREGLVIIAPGPEGSKSSEKRRVVTVVLPEEQIPELKDKLKTNELVSV